MNTASTTPEKPAARRWRWRGRRPRHRLLATLALLVAAIVVLILLWDWNWFKGPVERAVQARIGREFHIHGNFDVDLGSTTTLRGDSLTFANADWAEKPEMARADRAEVDIRVWPLLRGRFHLPEIRLTRPDVLLQSAPREGERGNWDFLPDSKGGNKTIVQRLLIDDGRLQFLHPRDRTDILVSLDSADRRGREAAVVEVKGKGLWRGNPFTIEGVTESPLELTHTDQPFRIHLDGRAGRTHAIARGSLTNPFQLRTFDLQLTLSGQDMAELYPLLGLAIPNTPPYKLDGRLRRDDNIWHYQDFKGTAGDSDLSGTVRIETGRERPFFKADLFSKKLDFDDLAGFVGAPPRTGAGETANAQQKAEAARQAARSKVLPDQPYNLEKLGAMDADVRWKAERILSPVLPLDDMDAHLVLENRLLRLDPLNFGVAGGDIRSTVRMDARKRVITTQLKGSMRKLELGKLFPDAKLAEQASGGVNGEFDLTGNGNSVAAMLGSSNGEVAIGMGRGHIGNLVMELAGLDVAESLKFLVTGDKQIPLRCAFGDFAVANGVMSSRALAFDTSDTLIVGEGDVSLKDETLDLLLKPRPKDISILALRSPLRIGGTFKDPSFRPDMKALGIRGAIALTLGSITPPAALLATFEPGPGKDSNCGGKYAK